MTRWTLAGFLALAALGTVGAVAVLDVGSATAEAAPSVSQFAGTYAWSNWPATVTISDGGQITSSYSNAGNREKGSISGRVGADGGYSFTVNQSGYTCLDERCRFPERWKSSSKSVGDMALDADGNIVGTPDTGGSFLWLRQ